MFLSVSFNIYHDFLVHCSLFSLESEGRSITVTITTTIFISIMIVFHIVIVVNTTVTGVITNFSLLSECVNIEDIV